MKSRLLSGREYRATFAGRMIDIKGREDLVQPEGVIDLGPYLAAIPQSDFGTLGLLSGAPAAAVYRSDDGRFDHVLYPCNRSNGRIATAVCAPLTSNLTWADAPGRTLLPAKGTGLPKDSVANASQIVAVDRSSLTERVRRLRPKQLAQILHGIDVVLDR